MFQANVNDNILQNNKILTATIFDDCMLALELVEDNSGKDNILQRASLSLFRYRISRAEFTFCFLRPLVTKSYSCYVVCALRAEYL